MQINVSALRLARNIARELLRLWLKLKSQLLPKPTAGGGRFEIRTRGTNLRVSLGPGAQLVLHSNVYIQSDLGNRGDVDIRVGENAKLEFAGEFTIGAGTLIAVRKNGELLIKGKQSSSGSGITSDSRIMVFNSVSIGADTIIACDVFITDCDWHTIKGSNPNAAVVIGDSTWIARGASILKGTRVGEGSVVACGAVLPGRNYPAGSLIAGNPAQAVRENVTWKRELEIV